MDVIVGDKISKFADDIEDSWWCSGELSLATELNSVRWFEK